MHIDDRHTEAQIERINSDVLRSAAEIKRTRAETITAYCKAAMFLAFGIAAIALSN